MANIATLIDSFLASNPEVKETPDYLQIKNGLLPLKVGYNNNPQPRNNNKYPTLQIKLDGNNSVANNHHNSNEHSCSNIKQISLSQTSRSWPTSYSLSNLISLQLNDESNHICDNIIEESIRNSSLRVCINADNELQQIEEELSQIIQSGTVDVNTFSNNCITNITEYGLEGDPRAIKNCIIDHSIKNYIEYQEDQYLLFNKLPHPIRKSHKRLKQICNIDKKSEREIMHQFQILNSMFDSKQISNQSANQYQKQKQNDYRILDAVNLIDNSYEELWEKIVGDIKITKQQKNKQQKIKHKINAQINQNQRMTDDQFQSAIHRIVKEAVQYQKQTMEIENQEGENNSQQQDKDVQVIQEVQQLMEESENKDQQSTKKMGEESTDFSKAKIQKKTQLTTTSKHQYAIQDNSDLTNFYDLLPKQKFACQYKFQLDEFQKRSVLHLQKKESIFVAAHTSAGKTVVAEYGIALAIKHKRKVIYTSPIKALSNQKYRQLSIKFGPENVGIVTGDVSMNQQASCVIMTTEILRNNLYRGAEMIRDIEWVIFDEVHYINNQERGVVWEETIIMLPQHIGIIMLSATVPNYMDFANWVGRTKRRIIYVMKTLHRPVPLEHSIYIFNKYHVIKEANGRFLKEEFNELHHQIRMAHTNQDIRSKALKEQKKKKIEERGFYNDPKREQRVKLMNKNAVDKFIKNITRTDMETAEGREDYRILQELIVDCNKKKLLPCVIFTFSKKKINALAAKIYSYDLTNHSQKSRIVRMISSALSNLKPEDQQIEQFIFLKEICINGYAVHHGDLLPLAKEIVELLFSQGLIKVLFATQTFAMGINMPTKTVIFNSIKKVTGSQGQLRFLNSSQYVQMSGRAGRRGLDQKGTVIIIVKDPSQLPESSQMQKMVDHPGQRLQSKFKVTYQIILNLINSDEFGVTEMMRQSFLQNPKFSEFASNIKSLKQYQNEYQILSQFQCPYNKLGTRILMDEYMSHAKNLKAENETNFNQILPKYQKYLPKYAKFLGYNNQQQIGLVLRVDAEKGPKNRSVQVMVVNKLMIEIDINKQDRENMEKALGIKKKVVLQYDEDRKANSSNRFSSGEVPGTHNQYHYYTYWISPSTVQEIYQNKIQSKFTFEEKKQDFQQLSLHLVDMKQKLIPVSKSQKKQQLYSLFISSQCHTCEMKEKHQHQYQRRAQVKTKLTECAKKLDTNELGLMGSFEGMLLLLNRFGFINQTAKQDGSILNTLTLKGRIAKEVDIFVAQLVVEAILDPLDHAQIAALLSAFVCDYKPRPGKNDKGEQEAFIEPIPKHQNFTTQLSRSVGKTLKIVQQITAEQEQLQAYVNLTAASMEEHILSIVNFHLSDTVYKWAIGFDFNEARIGTQAPQGTIVRTIMRLSQLLANTKSVCRIIGNSQLQNKINDALQAIKRDIVFCQSLYLTN